MAMNFKQKASGEWAKYVRVWRLLKKPTMDEFKMVSKVSAIGIAVIGAIGFIISVSMKLVLK